MKKLTHSFRTRLFVGFLVASLVPVLLCSAMLLQVFRLRLDSQADEESRGQLNRVTASLNGLYAGFRQTALALQASPYVAPALASGQEASGMVYSELYGATEGSRSAARFDLCDSQGTSLYSTGSTPLETPLSPNWGVLYAARQTRGLAFSQVDGGEGNASVLFQGAAQISDDEGKTAGYLVITMTRGDFSRLLEGQYGSQSNLLLLNSYWRPVYASRTSLADDLAPLLREHLLSGTSLSQAGDGFSYGVAFQEELGLYVVLQQAPVPGRRTPDGC